MAEKIRSKLIRELIPSKGYIIEKLKENNNDEETYNEILDEIKRRLIDENTWVGALHNLEDMMKEEGYPVNITLIAQFLSPYWEKYSDHQKAVKKAFEAMLKVAEESGYKPKPTKKYTLRTPEEEKRLRYSRKERRKNLGLI